MIREFRGNSPFFSMILVICYFLAATMVTSMHHSSRGNRSHISGAHSRIHPSHYNPASSAPRCRTFEDLGNIPWTKKTTTFYNLGFPLIKDICGFHHSHNSHGGMGIEKKIETSKLLLGCEVVKRRHWPRGISNATKNGVGVSTILVDPPCIDDGGASSGVFTINAVFAILFQRGYKVRIRNWSPGFNNVFPKATVDAAMNDTTRWDAFLAKKSNTAPNPFLDVTNYVAFQVEIGTVYLLEPAQNGKPEKPEPPEIITSPHGRHFRWIIGYHHPSTHKWYQSDKHHCIGANFHLGEGLHCASSSVVMVPMFSFHQEASLTPENPLERLKLKKNIVLIDGDAKEFNANEIARRLQELGMTGICTAYLKTSFLNFFLSFNVFNPFYVKNDE